MPRRWNKIEEKIKEKELSELYVKENKTIEQIAKELRLGQTTVYERLVRLGIKVARHRKEGFNNIHKVRLPKRSAKLAELIGILLGDGNLKPTQVTVTLGTKEDQYAEYVAKMMGELFQVKPKISRKRGEKVAYFGSTVAVRWLLAGGLALNKVKEQVDIPAWCRRKKIFMEAVVRGLIDTDGSVYRLRAGRVQISLCNRSLPILKTASIILKRLGFHPSRISCYKIYLTRKDDVLKYYREIGFSNQKHSRRFTSFLNNGQVPEWSKGADCRIKAAPGGNLRMNSLG